MSSPSATIAATVRQLLSVHGAMTEEGLLDMLEEDGLDLGPDPDGILADVLEENAELLMPLADERWCWVPALLERRIFTHRLSALEVDHDLIQVGPDLAPLSLLTELEPYQRLVDGSRVADVSPLLDGEVLAERGVPALAVGADGALLFDPGRFAELSVAAGDLVGLRVTADGFDLAAVEALSDCAAGAALTDLLDESPDRPALLSIAVWTVCADDDRLFRELAAPLADLLSASDLAQEGDWVAPGGFDFRGWRVGGRIETMKERYELDDDEALAVLRRACA